MQDYKIALEALFLLKDAVENLENCYGRETELTKKIRKFLDN